MKSSLSLLGLGDLFIEIHLPENLPLLSEKRFMPFQTNASASDICWEYHIIAVGSQTSTTPDQQINLHQARVNRLGDGNAILRMPQVQKRLEQARDHTEWLTIEMHPGAVTVLDFKENRADMFISQEFATELGNHGIGPAMLALFMPHFSAMLLHASALVRNNRTAIFLAPDEGGKTTAALLASSGTILSDDQVLVRQTHVGFQASGTPWGLYCNSKLQAPLSGLFLLEKSGHFALNPLPPKELSRYLWEEHKNQLAILPPPLQTKARKIIVAISNSAPTWKLSFAKDAIDWEAIDKAMAG
ncbi:MAG: hypothetical protein WCL37_05340 [Chrysiogenales bacterium]